MSHRFIHTHDGRAFVRKERKSNQNSSASNRDNRSTMEIKRKCKKNDERTRRVLIGTSKRIASSAFNLSAWRPTMSLRMELKWEDDEEIVKTALQSDKSEAEAGGSSNADPEPVDQGDAQASGREGTAEAEADNNNVSIDTQKENEALSEVNDLVEVPELSVQMLEDLQNASLGVIAEDMAEKLKLWPEMPFGVEEIYEPLNPKPNLSAIINMIKPAIEAHTTPGTKKQKALYMNYWGSYCAAYGVNASTFGKMTTQECVDPEFASKKCWKKYSC